MLKCQQGVWARDPEIPLRLKRRLGFCNQARRPGCGAGPQSALGETAYGFTTEGRVGGRRFERPPPRAACRQLSRTQNSFLSKTKCKALQGLSRERSRGDVVGGVYFSNSSPGFPLFPPRFPFHLEVSSFLHSDVHYALQNPNPRSVSCLFSPGYNQKSLLLAEECDYY